MAAKKKTDHKFIKVKGSRVKGNTQKIGEFLVDYSNQHNHKITPKELVKEARNKKNPCHTHFTWDNTKAAELYRLDQARYLLRSILVIEVERENVTYRPVFVCNRYGGQETAPYKDFVEVMKNPDERALLLACAMAEFEAFRKKYGRLVELAALFAAYDKIKNKKN